MNERYAEHPGPAWAQMDSVAYDYAWASFEQRYGFRASTKPERWPAINEPPDSLTLDLSCIGEGPRRAAAYDAVNAEALRCFVWALPDVEELVVLDWQHPAYRFKPAVQALTWRAEWQVPVYPDGDYFSFMTPDMAEGTFGHPWEQTLCLIGERLITTLGRSLSSWLPVRRAGGKAVAR